MQELPDIFGLGSAAAFVAFTLWALKLIHQLFGDFRHARANGGSQPSRRASERALIKALESMSHETTQICEQVDELHHWHAPEDPPGSGHKIWWNTAGEAEMRRKMERTMSRCEETNREILNWLRRQKT